MTGKTKNETACIDDLIGPRLRAHGIHCMCPKHRESGEVGAGLKPARTQESDGKSLAPDCKMRAAHDDTNSEL